MTTQSETRPVSTGKKVLAAVLDFFTAFFGFGYIVAAVTGGTSDGGFDLSGGPAFLLFALVIAYFVVLGRYGGGTIWQRILGTKR